MQALKKTNARSMSNAIVTFTQAVLMESRWFLQRCLYCVETEPVVYQRWKLCSKQSRLVVKKIRDNLTLSTMSAKSRSRPPETHLEKTFNQMPLNCIFYCKMTEKQVLRPHLKMRPDSSTVTLHQGKFPQELYMRKSINDVLYYCPQALTALLTMVFTQ